MRLLVLECRFGVQPSDQFWNRALQGDETPKNWIYYRGMIIKSPKCLVHVCDKGFPLFFVDVQRTNLISWSDFERGEQQRTIDSSLFSIAVHQFILLIEKFNPNPRSHTSRFYLCLLTLPDSKTMLIKALLRLTAAAVWASACARRLANDRRSQSLFEKKQITSEEAEVTREMRALL